MKANDKINVSKYLKDLNDLVDNASRYSSFDKCCVRKISCKDLADLCEVTPATISNLSTNSKFFLLHKVAGEILDSYYGFFEFDERQARKDYPDEMIYPRDINYVLMYLTSYYTDEWLKG